MADQDIYKAGVIAAGKEAPDTAEMKAFAAFLAASFESGMSGDSMREAVRWSLGSTNAGEAAPVAWIDPQADEAVTSSRRASWPAHNQARYTVPAYAHPPAAVHGQSASTEGEDDAHTMALRLKPDEFYAEFFNSDDWRDSPLSAYRAAWFKCIDELRLRGLLATPPAAIPAAPSEAALQEAHRLGFLRAAGWMQRDDLFDDVASPAYRKDRDHDLAALAHPAPVEQEAADNEGVFTTPHPLLNNLLQETYWLGKGPNSMDTGLSWHAALQEFLATLTPPAVAALQTTQGAKGGA